ncbi:MAG TPA: 2-oxoacid:acceptor oxidoreductase family protein, partial [Acidimicrobiales bacterium]|nr:2-oxoacid:acceptor oxidoreductase family protein [Acidimicrobiales bacterium]
ARAWESGCMFQVRVHGRGGQGVVTAAELLSVAAFLDGRFAQAFPSFGSERKGAPVIAYCRISDQAIRTREPIAAPDALIIQDPTLLRAEGPLLGAGEDAFVLLNTVKPWTELDILGGLERFRPERVVNVPATEIALAQVGRPIPNAALLGGFAALTGAVRFSAIVEAIRGRFPGAIGERNIAAASEARRLVNVALGKAEAADEDAGEAAEGPQARAAKGVLSGA